MSYMGWKIIDYGDRKVSMGVSLRSLANLVLAHLKYRVLEMANSNRM